MAKSKPFDDYSDRYEAWFDRNSLAYESELRAIKVLLPCQGTGMEVGVGSGRFASRLGIRFGVEPSIRMGAIASARGVITVAGVAEYLPYRDSCFDCVLMVTTICFLDDVGRALRESFRVIRPGGSIVIGFVDRHSRLGEAYLRHKHENPFYSVAEFYSADEVRDHLLNAGFEGLEFRQTIFKDLAEIHEIEPTRTGYGEGSFVAVRGLRP